MMIPCGFIASNEFIRYLICRIILRALGASKLDSMLKVGIPRTRPCLFGSLKVAIPLALVGTVVSEDADFQHVVCHMKPVDRVHEMLDGPPVVDDAPATRPPGVAK